MWDPVRFLLSRILEASYQDISDVRSCGSAFIIMRQIRSLDLNRASFESGHVMQIWEDHGSEPAKNE